MEDFLDFADRPRLGDCVLFTSREANASTLGEAAAEGCARVASDEGCCTGVVDGMWGEGAFELEGGFELEGAGALGVIAGVCGEGVCVGAGDSAVARIREIV